ncbi:uncharacterized protein LOC126887844 [Diabrotica virgifera virgifera]|uniref:RING-type domain-containing protein n=1 Tax=Diabrotica virgifera virgifera TaxID=50390 RepID=A0ABM5KNB9_DIAVI|nr:uncharacterized protein LOC126887844 [Diabrotica virgifera virgifera]
MLEEVIGTISLIKTTINYGLYFSFKTGQFLVFILNSLLSNLNILLKNISVLIVIIFESFTVFLQDILQGIQVTVDVLGQIWDTISFGFSSVIIGVTNIVYKVLSVIYRTYALLIDSTVSFYTLIIAIIQLIKHFIVLFGAGVWFVITIIPFSIISLLNLIATAIKSVLHNIYDTIVTTVLGFNDCLKNIYIFVTDVPVESAIGLIFAACIIYVITQFNVAIYLYSRRVYLNSMNRFRRPFVAPVVRRQPLRNERNYLNLPMNRRPEVRRSLVLPEIRRSLVSPEIRSFVGEATPNMPNKNDNTVVDERYCVICQERSKCVLVLPCKHVCMCMECNAQLQLYHTTCPICRNDIESTMKIFV